MFLRLLVKVPRKVIVAVSGGPDSMVALDFLKRAHDVTAIHFNHGTQHGEQAEIFVRQYVKDNNIKSVFGKINREIMPGESKEAFWRKCRYDFFQKVSRGEKVVVAHNLDDAVETWIFTSLNGRPTIIPKERDNYIRPFLLNTKSSLEKWAEEKGVPYVIDPGNSSCEYARVRIRKMIIPELLKVNPGLYKVIAKKYVEQL